MGPDGGYRLDAGAELPPLLFDDDQAVAVAVALQTARVSGVGIEEAAIRALATIRQVMPSRLRRRLDAFEVTAVPGTGLAAPHEVSIDLLVTLADTIRAREVLRFDYVSRAGHDDDHQLRPPRRAEPHHLVTSHGRWYLVAWDLDRTNWRLFRADRISPRVPTGPRFTPRVVPGGDVGEFVAARFKGSEVNAWPCRGTVIVHLPAHDVLPFAGDGTVVAMGDDRCSVEAGSWSWGALAVWYARFEVAMVVVGPPELTAAFAALARRYESATTTSTG